MYLIEGMLIVCMERGGSVVLDDERNEVTGFQHRRHRLYTIKHNQAAELRQPVSLAVKGLGIPCG